jgi:hypothetical protein
LPITAAALPPPASASHGGRWHAVHCWLVSVSVSTSHCGSCRARCAACQASPYSSSRQRGGGAPTRGLARSEHPSGLNAGAGAALGAPLQPGCNARCPPCRFVPVPWCPKMSARCVCLPSRLGVVRYGQGEGGGLGDVVSRHPTARPHGRYPGCHCSMPTCGLHVVGGGGSIRPPLRAEGLVARSNRPPWACWLRC